MNLLLKAKHTIKNMKIQTMKPKEEHRLFLLFFIGVVVGTFLINWFGTSREGDLNIYSSYLAGGHIIGDKSINKWSYGLYCFWNYIKEFAVVFLFNLTPFGRIFNGVYLLFKGTLVGMLISAATLAYGAGGLFLYIVSVFPHYISYIPLVVCYIYVSSRISEQIRDKKGRLNIRALLIIVGLAALTAGLEAYVNYPLLQFIY